MSEPNTAGAVSIRSYRLVRDYLGDKDVQWEIPDDGTVGSLIEDIADEHGADPDEFVAIVNGSNIKQLEGLRTQLHDGDELTLSLGSVPE